MSDIATKLAELKQLRNDIRTAIENKGAYLPIGSPMANYATAIETIQAKMPIIVLDNTNVAPMVPYTARIDPDLEGLAIITSEINDVSYLFKNSKIQSVVNLTLGVASMENMFYESQATTLDLSSFNTSNVTNMSGMFRDSSATTLDLSSFDTSSVTNMSSMFNNSSATTLDLSSFDTSSVTNMSFMFNNSSATTLDLSSFDTSSVTDMADMFYESQIKTVYVRNETEKGRFESMATNTPSDLEFVVKVG